MDFVLNQIVTLILNSNRDISRFVFFIEVGTLYLVVFFSFISHGIQPP